MAQVAAPGSQTTNPPYAQQNAPHGRKRAADSSLENEQRLSKRFDLLNLVDTNGTRLYIPVPGSTDRPSSQAHAKPTPCPDPLAFIPTKSPRKPKRRIPRSDDSGMEVEDTPHRVYISDLSAELSDIESDEENPIFLSDIEKHLSKIPRHVLVGPEPKPTEKNQLVVYNVPTSLSVPEAQDGVRKAIVEARQRIRERQGNANTVPVPFALGTNGVEIRKSHVPPTGNDDVEAMDID